MNLQQFSQLRAKQQNKIAKSRLNRNAKLIRIQKSAIRNHKGLCGKKNYSEAINSVIMVVILASAFSASRWTVS